MLQWLHSTDKWCSEGAVIAFLAWAAWLWLSVSDRWVKLFHLLELRADDGDEAAAGAIIHGWLEWRCDSASDNPPPAATHSLIHQELLLMLRCTSFLCREKQRNHFIWPLGIWEQCKLAWMATGSPVRRQNWHGLQLLARVWWKGFYQKQENDMKAE